MLVDRMVERLAHRRILELRTFHVEGEGLDGRGRIDGHDLAFERLGFVIVVGRDPLQADDVDVAGLELRVHDVEIRNVLVDHPLDMGAVGKIVGIGLEQDIVARDALLPLERTRADRRIVVGGGVLVGFRA